MGAALSTPRFTSVLLSMFAVLALTLVGGRHLRRAVVRGQPAHARDRHRVAIGAGRVQVLQMVLGSGVSLALAGIAAGLVARAAARRGCCGGCCTASPRPIRRRSPSVAVGADRGGAALASVVPAWRASRVDPVIALKSE